MFFSKKFKAARYLKGIMVISYMLPMTVVGLMFKFMLSPTNGVINDILMNLHLVKAPVEWLLNEKTVIWGLIIANTWVEFLLICFVINRS